MRLLPLLLAVAALGVVAPVRAQILDITVGGETTYPGSGLYSSLPSGTPYTFTAAFDTSKATLLTSNAYSATYTDPTGTSSFSFAGFTFSGTAPQIQITSNQPDFGGSDFIYGFEFSQFLPEGAGYAVQILSIDSSVAPTISLDSLHTSPITDFFQNLNLGTYESGPETSFVSGTNTSFSVQAQAAPEPAPIALALAAMVMFAWLRRSQLRRNA